MILDSGVMVQLNKRLIIDAHVRVLCDLTLQPGVLIEVTKNGLLVFAPGTKIRVEHERPPVEPFR